MSTITKIFVVLTLLLSIAYCVAAAFLYTYSQDYKKKFEDKQRELDETVAQKDDEIKNHKSDLGQKKEQITSLTETKKKLERDVDETTKRLNDTKDVLHDAQTNLQKATETGRTQARRITDLGNDKNRLEESISKLEERLGDLEGNNDKLTKELAVMTDDKKKVENILTATKKELNDKEERLAEFEKIHAKLAEMGIKVPDLLVPGEAIHGQVLAVDPATDIVVLSVGENAHVTKGMKLSVYRGDAYVGAVVIISVFPDMCSARILRDKTPKEIKAGDNVTNRF